MSTGSVLLDRPAATYREAEQAGHEAREQFKQRFRSYGRIRLGSKERDSDRARAEWSLAGVVYIHALATIGATEDRLNTAWRSKLRHLITEFACTSRSPLPESNAAPASADAETDDLAKVRQGVWACWDTYHHVRASPGRDQLGMDDARRQLEHALLELLQAVVAVMAGQDKQHITEVRNRQDLGMALHSSDAFPATAWTSHVGYKTRERARRDALERDKHRYDRLTTSHLSKLGQTQTP